MACPDCDSPAGDLRFATSVETHGLDCGPTKHSTKNSSFVASAAGDMTSVSGMACKSCVRSAFHQIASRLRQSD